MTSILLSIMFLFSIFFLIIFHELGHALTAKLFGVKVLRFSIGLGKPLWRKTLSSGMEIAISAIPLGGYVKMLDEREGNVSLHEMHLAFNRQPLFKRTLIILAGPMFNIFLAIFLYWIMVIVGIHQVKPVISEVIPHSIAARAGVQPNSEIISIDGQSADNWRAVLLSLVWHIGNKGSLNLETRALDTQHSQSYTLPLANWVLGSRTPDLFKSLGFVQYQPKGVLSIKEVTGWGPAAQAGLKPGDKILKLAETKINTLEELHTLVNAQAGKSISVSFLHETRNLTSVIDVEKKVSFNGRVTGRLGVTFDPIPWPETMLRFHQKNPAGAVLYSLQMVWDLLVLSSIILIKIILGKISLKSLVGPLGIFQNMVWAVQLGLMPYLDFLARLSVSLAFINLLPIPGLDGSQLGYLLIEKIRGKAVSVRVQVLAFRLGVIMITVLMIQILLNDLLRL